MFGIKKSKERKLARNRLSLQKFLLTKYKGNIKKFSKRNNNYLIEHLIFDDNIYKLVKNPKKVKKTLLDKLESIPHTYRKQGLTFNNYPYDESPYNVLHLTSSQLVRVYVVMQNLGNKDFVNKIGSLLEADLKDIYTEHGGLVLFDDNHELILRNFESEFAKEKDVKNRKVYKIPLESRDILHIARHHFHAFQDDCSEYAGPSVGNILEGGDISTCLMNTTCYGESHNLVVTKLKNSRFNIDYYGGDNRKIGKQLSVLDLGNYDYEV